MPSLSNSAVTERTDRAKARSYCYAVLLVLVAMGLRLALHPLMGPSPPLILFPAVLAAGWFWGVRPGLLALVIGAIIGWGFLWLTSPGAFPNGHDYFVGAFFIAFTVPMLYGVAMAGQGMRRARAAHAQLQASQQALRENEERLRMVIEAAQLGLWDNDPARGDVWWSDKLFELLGMDKTVDRPFTFEEFIDHVHPDDRQLVNPKPPRAPGTPFHMEFRIRCKDGAYRWFLNHSYETLSRDGKSTRTVGACMDTTDRRTSELAVQLERERLRMAMDAANLGMWDTDEINGTVWWSDKMWDLLRLPRDHKAFTYTEFLGHVHPDDREAVREMAMGFAGGAPVETEFRMRRGDNTWGWFRDYALGALTPEGKLARTVGACLDITARKEAQAERERLLQLEQAARHAAQLAEQKFRQLVEDLDAVVWEFDWATEKFTFVSRRAEEMFGYPIEKWIQGGGEFWINLIHPDERASAATFCKAESDAGRNHRFEYRAITADGRVIWVHDIVYIVRDGAVPPKLRGLLVDITERKQAEQEREKLHEQLAIERARLESILAAAPVGVALLDRDLRYVRINDLLAENNGLAPTEHVGRHIKDVIPHLWDQVEPHLRHVLATGTPVLNTERSNAIPIEPDRLRDWLCSYYPVRSNGELLGVGAVIVEITQRKQIERELQAAKEKAEAADRAKDQFLAVLSHELRTPLTPVLAAVTKMKRDADISADLRGTFELIQRNVELEARLIDDLLDLTRVSKGKLPLHRHKVDAHASLAAALEICRSEIAEKEQSLTLELGAGTHHVYADPARLQQVFWNLLKNAVKFTPHRGRITVRTSNSDCSLDPGSPCPPLMGLAAPPGSKSLPVVADAPAIQIQIIDTGIGMTAEVIERIFNAFDQGNATITRRFGGLGLGLVISRSVVQAHGGNLVAHSPGPDRGSTFTICLPTIEAPSSADQLTPSLAPHAPPALAVQRSLRILLVEDNRDTLRVMARLLRQSGHTIEIAETMNTAIDVLKSRPVDLLISDIGLPDGSGLELMEHVKTNYPELRAIALSGYGMDADMEKSAEAGFAMHLIKPVPFEAMEDAIASVIG